jgi:hypothetical protein
LKDLSIGQLGKCRKSAGAKEPTFLKKGIASDPLNVSRTALSCGIVTQLIRTALATPWIIDDRARK